MVLEIAAYYVPFFDNMLDTLAAPVAVLAGIVASASVLTDLPPWLQYSIAIIGAGGTAGRRSRLDVAAAAEKLGSDGRFRQSDSCDARVGWVDRDRAARGARAAAGAGCGRADCVDGGEACYRVASCERPRCCSIQYSLTAPASYCGGASIGRTVW